VFDLSEGDDARGPWNQAPDFDYIADPQPLGGMPASPVNTSDEKQKASSSKQTAKNSQLTLRVFMADDASHRCVA
jgi:Mn-containing catalase